MLHRTTQKQNPHYGKWNGLGGKIEPNESPEDALKREVYEESGLQIVSQQLCGILTFPAFLDERHWTVFVYTSSSFKGRMKRRCVEGDLSWIADTDLLTLNLWEADAYFLQWIRQKVFFSAKFTYNDQGQFTKKEVTFYPEDLPHASKKEKRP